MVGTHRVGQGVAPQASLQGQAESLLDQGQRVAAEDVQEAGQQGIRHAAHDAAHAVDTHLQPISGAIHPAGIAAPEDASVLVATVRAADRPHECQERVEANLVVRQIVVVVDRTGKVEYHGHGVAQAPRTPVAQPDQGMSYGGAAFLRDSPLWSEAAKWSS
jgi:hypothetical protein